MDQGIGIKDIFLKSQADVVNNISKNNFGLELPFKDRPSDISRKKIPNFT